MLGSIKIILQSIIIAFSMFSKFPMPHIEWSEKGMKYMVGFFPIVGIVVGLVEYFVGKLLFHINISNLLFGCIMSVLPVFLTGGIHLDGFLDTMDGISSYADKEKRLEILKDSNSGAFAIIGGIVYFVLYVGFMSEIDETMLFIIGISYCMSRALSGFALITFKQAREKGLGATFSKGSDKRIVQFMTVVFMLLVLVIGFKYSVIGGAVILIAGIVVFSYHYWNCMHNFGGITGDLAGFFLQIYEIAVVMLLVMAKYIGVWNL